MDGATKGAVAGAHEKDMAVQGQYGVDYKHYWVDESSGGDLLPGGDAHKEAAERVHREAHGLVADEIYEVHQGA